MAKFKTGDVVYVHGIDDPRKNTACKGAVHHDFISYGLQYYVIAMEILDGDFVVRCDNTTWRTDQTHKEPKDV